MRRYFARARSGLALGSEWSYEIRGIEEPILSNVRNHLESFSLIGQPVPNGRNNEHLIQDAEEHARAGLRPYGYYQPEINSEIKRAGSDNWVLLLVFRFAAYLKYSPLVQAPRKQLTGD